ncbi:hypothetical protein BMS3Abin03_02668 [bacterium BMS3Abin03]|nr:hypothetical protein BMS3Abin03_02668 [bacterium BMS3Abin03]
MKELTVYTINNKQELKELLSHHKISFLPRRGKINISLDHMTETDKLRWEKKLCRYFFECGCDMGARFSVAFLLLFVAYVLFFSDLKNMLNYQTIVYGIASVIIGAVLGKLLGLIYYKIMLYHTVNKLLKREQIVN